MEGKNIKQERKIISEKRKIVLSCGARQNKYTRGVCVEASAREVCNFCRCA